MIKVEKAEVYLTEHELREIVRIIDDLKKDKVFTTEPIPDGDMSEDTARQLGFDRGIIPIIAGNKKIRFIIDLRNTQESMSYYLNIGTDSI